MRCIVLHGAVLCFAVLRERDRALSDSVAAFVANMCNRLTFFVLKRLKAYLIPNPFY